MVLEMTERPTDAPDKVTYEEAARIFGVKQTTVQAWVSRYPGHIKTYRRPFDRRRYVSISEIRAFREQEPE